MVYIKKENCGVCKGDSKKCSKAVECPRDITKWMEQDEYDTEEDILDQIIQDFSNLD